MLSKNNQSTYSATRIEILYSAYFRRHIDLSHTITEERHTMSAEDDSLTPQYTPDEIAAFNQQLASKTPQEILVWAIDNLEGLYQTTAFGL